MTIMGRFGEDGLEQACRVQEQPGQLGPVIS